MKKKKILFFVVLKEIFERKIEGFNLDQLSELCIELDVNNYNLTSIIEGLNGLSTPHLEYRLQELIIFGILNKNTSYYLTKKSIVYVDEQTKIIYENKDYKDFIGLTNKLVGGIFLKGSDNRKGGE